MHGIKSIAAIAGLASLAVASPVEKRATPGSFQIKQVQTGQKLAVGAVAYQKAYQKYNKAVPAVVAAAAQQGAVTATPEQYDSEYLCPVTVGANTLNLDFDTGSADLWVFSSLLPSSEQAGHSIYNVASGKKITGDTWKISYGDGSGAAGTVYADKVVIGPVTATTQAVEAATSISSAFQQDTDNDGLVGLAFSTINTVSPKPVTTFFDTVKANLTSKLFAADLKKGAAGVYDFGYIDTTKYTGSIVYTPVDSSQGFWMFTSTAYSIGTTKTSASISGIADTGTSLLLLDASIVTAYYKKVTGSKNDSTQGGYTFPCTATLPDFSITVGGAVRTVPGSYMNFAPIDNTGKTCFGGIQSNAGVGFSIFGDIFLKSQYVIFDQTTSSPRLGFGQQA
ncbi:aspartic protease pep1 [Microthyrium microscopicum]|uniref:Aspartic protease pep1 n=1 Tax=Microthyrium microscopicum TaxID=703497 RepID=A0A6A6U2N0_9PEZI|nr:aspartic protease pep1 [Microthyrium microscopicum]